jgi:signal peptidase II
VQIRRRITVETSRPGLLFWAIAFTILILDQVSKLAVRAYMQPGETIWLLPGVFDITYVRNIGGAFGVLAGYRHLFIAVMVLVVVAVAVYWNRVRPRYTWIAVSLGLVVAGAIGNAIDRLDAGVVTDFIDVAGSYFAVFNIADSAVVVGVGMLLVWIVLAPETHVLPDEEAAEDDPANAEISPAEVTSATSDAPLPETSEGDVDRG